MLSVHIITSLGPKGCLRWIRSCLPVRLRWIYEALYHDEALVEHFVSFHLCLSVGIMIVSRSVSSSLFPSPRVSYVCAFWPLTPPFFWRCWLSVEDKWRCLSISPSSRLSRAWEAANGPLSVSAEAERRFDIVGKQKSYAAGNSIVSLQQV